MRRSYNIIFLGNLPYPYGMAGTKRVQGFIDYLCSQNIVPKVLLLRQGGDRISTERLSGVFQGVAYKTVGYGLKISWNLIYTLPLYFVEGYWTLLKWRRRKAVNYLYCYNGLDIENVLFVLFARALGYYVVFDIVEDFGKLERQAHWGAVVKKRSWVYFDKHIFRLANGLIVISTYLRDKYVALNDRGTPIRLIPVSAKVRAEVSISGDHRIVKFAYSGSFGDKDDVATLIAAFQRLHNRKGNIRLMLSGKGEGVDVICGEVSRGDSAITYVGYLSEERFEEFLSSADVLCMIRTNSEYASAGFPFKLGEYLATGKPVIASNVGDIAMYLEDGKDVFLVPALDVRELERAMEWCVDDYDRAAAIGMNGLAKCRRYFNWEENGKILMEIMRACEGKSGCVSE